MPLKSASVLLVAVRQKLTRSSKRGNNTMFKAVVFLSFIAATLAGRCESPKHSGSSYSTTDGFFHYHTTFIAEFALSCANNVRDVAFYAVVENKIYALAVSEESTKYQLSWHLDHDAANARTFTVKVFDEDSLAAYKKNPTTAPLFTHDHVHSGLSKKSPISPETVALLIALGALYYAMKQKSEIIA